MRENDINVVGKFGGSSIAQPNTVAEKITYPGNETDVMVVSAPAGLTDRLYGYDARAYRTQEEAESIQAHVAEFAAQCDPNCTNEEIQAVVGGVLTDMARWRTDGAPIMALGEYWAARIMAAHTGREFIDANHVIRFRRDGQLDANATFVNAHRELSGDGQYVVPGFYGADNEGRIHLLGRNGSDTSAAILAKVLEADRLDIWSDVPGFRTIDPRLGGGLLVPQITTREAREMYPGCTLLHRDVLRFTGRSGIAVYMRDTFGEPDNVGTIVKNKRDNVAEMPLVGIVGMHDMRSLEINQFGSEEETGTLTEVFDILGKNRIPIEDISSHVDGVSLTFQEEYDSRLPRYRGALIGLETDSRRAAVNRICGLRIVGEILDRPSERTRTLRQATTALDRAGAQILNPNGGGISLTFSLVEGDLNRIVGEVHDELIGGSK